MNVSAWSIRNPIPAILLFLLLTLAGLMGFRAMTVQNFPDIDLPSVTVSAALPGAAPAQPQAPTPSTLPPPSAVGSSMQTAPAVTPGSGDPVWSSVYQRYQQPRR